LNLNLIKRLEVQNDKHTTAATTTANDGGSISGSVAAASLSGNTRDNLAAVDHNNDDEDDNMELLQKRLVTLQTEVAIMQKKVERARQKVDLIKKNGVTAATADSKNIAGKGVGVVSVTSTYVFLLNCFPIDEKREISKHSLSLSLSTNIYLLL
jgi:hypothetical protein